MAVLGSRAHRLEQPIRAARQFSSHPPALPMVQARAGKDLEHLAGVLARRPFLVGEHATIADIACHAWLPYAQALGLFTQLAAPLQEWTSRITAARLRFAGTGVCRNRNRSTGMMMSRGIFFARWRRCCLCSWSPAASVRGSRLPPDCQLSGQGGRRLFAVEAQSGGRAGTCRARARQAGPGRGAGISRNG